MKSTLFIIIVLTVICVAYAIIVLKLRAIRRKRNILNEKQIEEFLSDLKTYGIPIEDDPDEPITHYYDPERDY